MAILFFPLGSLEISPHSLHLLDGGNWVENRLVFELKIGTQEFVLKSTETVLILHNHFIDFFKDAKHFIAQCQRNFSTVESFDFLPYHLDIHLTFLEGEIDNEQEGEITLQIMVNLQIIDPSLSSEYVGVITNANAKDIMNFLYHLEGELSLLS